MSDFGSRDRGTGEYDKPCRGCKVLDLIDCPMAEHAYSKNVKLIDCVLLKDFGERIIKAKRIRSIV